MAIWADRIGPCRLGGDLGRHPEPHLDLSNEFTRWMAKDPPMKGRQNRSTKGELGSIVRKGAGFDRGKGSSKGGWYRYQAGNMASDKASPFTWFTNDPKRPYDQCWKTKRVTASTRFNACLLTRVLRPKPRRKGMHVLSLQIPSPVDYTKPARCRAGREARKICKVIAGRTDKRGPILCACFYLRA